MAGEAISEILKPLSAAAAVRVGLTTAEAQHRLTEFGPNVAATIISGSVMVDQSMLTGASVPADADPGSQVYAGALIRRGHAVAEVMATGSKTYYGRTAELARIARTGIALSSPG